MLDWYTRNIAIPKQYIEWKWYIIIHFIITKILCSSNISLLQDWWNGVHSFKISLKILTDGVSRGIDSSFSRYSDPRIAVTCYGKLCAPSWQGYWTLVLSFRSSVKLLFPSTAAFGSAWKLVTEAKGSCLGGAPQLTIDRTNYGDDEANVWRNICTADELCRCMECASLRGIDARILTIDLEGEPTSTKADICALLPRTMGRF